MCDELVTKANANLSKISIIYTEIPSTNGLDSRTQYDSEKQNFKILKRLKILIRRYLILVDQSRRLIQTKKYNEIENKISSVTSLVATAALNTKSHRY